MWASKSVNWAFADTKIYLEGKSKPEVTAREEEIISLVARQTNNSRLTLMPNHEERKGFCVELPSELTVEAASAAFSDRWFGVVAVLRVPQEVADQSTVLQADDASKQIERIVEQFTLESPLDEWSDTDSLDAFVEASESSLSSRDTVSWKAGIGGHGHFIGVYADDSAPLAAAASADSLSSASPFIDDVDAKSTSGAAPLVSSSVKRSRQYYLVYHGDAGPVGRAFHKWLSTPEVKRRSLEDVYNSRTYERSREFAKRNASRALALLAEALDASMALGARPDWQAAPNPRVDPHEDAQDILPADKISFTMYNLLQRHPRIRTSLVYYNHSTPLVDASRLGSQGKTIRDGREVAFLKRPQDGIALYTLDPQHDYTSERHFKHLLPGGDVREYFESNTAAAAPIGTGKVPGYDAMRAASSLKLKALNAELACKVHWKNRATTGGGNWRLYAYRNPDSEAMLMSLRAILRPISGSPHSMRALTPVAVMIPSHDKK